MLHIEDSICTAEHFYLYRVLTKMVAFGQITEEEKEALLLKSGLTKIGPYEYKDLAGSILNFEVKQ